VSRDTVGDWNVAATPGWHVTVVRPAADHVVATDYGDADDAALMAASQRGQREAFDRIVDRHQRTIYRLCYRFVHDHAQADDLVQDVFLRAWRGVARFKGESSVATWLYRIAVNASLTRVSRRTPAHDPLDARSLVDQRHEDQCARVVRRERAQKLRRAVAQLPKRQRATLVLRVYHGLTHKEIAGILGNSVGSVKANFFHALRNLRRLLSESS
jgi:RNA polymerase sigma-70 factor (ECF subfamily)